MGVVPSSSLAVTANEAKLAVVDPSATIQRHACAECGVHLYGRIEREHPFRGLDFVHAELNEDGSGAKTPVEFAAFVSSIVEGGFEPHATSTDGDGGDGDEGKLQGKGARIGLVRERLRGIFGEKVYDCLSPGLMDLIAEWEGRRSGKLKAVL